MCPVLSPTSVAVSNDCFSKDGRKIHIGDCALFKPPQDSPPFIGIIRRLTVGKEGPKLSVNWLYRPADVKLGKGNLLEAAPNEIFYSFHKDEIPAASLLHPCKVTFLRKGVKLPSGISSFVCRRVYDIENKCLWWLTDQDYINEWQEEVDRLLEKTRQEMHGMVQPGGHSPNPINGPILSTQLKPSTDIVLNSVSSPLSQGKGKKKERIDQGSDVIKREHLSKIDDGDSSLYRSENILKSDIAKITQKGSLIDLDGVDKLLQLMKPDRSERNVDLVGRIMLVDVIVITDRLDCLRRFVQLKGLPVLDEWLQEVRKGKICNGNTVKLSDKSVESFLLLLLRALDKLPVNLDALQTCNVGKSVNHLRSHKNFEIQKKARSLVDTWKKQVEAEMNMNDAKSDSIRSVAWPSKVASSDTPNTGSRNIGVSSEGIKSFSMKPSTVKACQGEDATKFSIDASLGHSKPIVLLTTSVDSNSKVTNSKINIGSARLEPHLGSIKKEKSSNSSQSQNSESCSSDHPIALGSSCREDARMSTAVSGGVIKISCISSRHQISSNEFSDSVFTGVQKEIDLGKFNSLNRKFTSEKLLGTELTSDKPPHMALDQVNNQRLIVRLPNTIRSPAQCTSGGSFDDPDVSLCRSTACVERNDNHDWKSKGNNDCIGAGIALSAHLGFCHDNDDLDESREGNGPVVEHRQVFETCEIPTEILTNPGSLSGIMADAGKSYDASLSPINALIESCAKFSEDSPSSSGDDLGMNLLASVAASELFNPTIVSPLGSPQIKHPLPEDRCSDIDSELKHFDAGTTQTQNHPQLGVIEVNGIDSTCCNESKHPSIPLPAYISGNDSLFSNKVKLRDEHMLQVKSLLQQNTEGPRLTLDGQFHKLKFEPSTTIKEHNQLIGERNGSVIGTSALVLDSVSKLQSPLSNYDINCCCVDEKTGKNVETVTSDAAASIGKVVKDVTEDSISCTDSERANHDKYSTHDKSTNNALLDQKHPSIVKNYYDISSIDFKAEKAGKIKLRDSVDGNEKQKLETVSSIMDENLEGMEDASTLKVSLCALDESVKLDFDLNESFSGDDWNQWAFKSLPMSGSCVPITVASASKGPFVPPENLLRSKGELGWKGSAATSAFRPTEPRKTLEVPLSPTDVSISDVTTTKQGRVVLDIDLNVPDEGIHKEMMRQNSVQVTSSDSEPRRHCGTGLDLDLNLTYDNSDAGQVVVCDIGRLEIPSLSSKPSLSGNFFNGEITVSRGFDLNNGPEPDEISSEVSTHSYYPKNNMSCPYSFPVVRANGSELGNITHSFPLGNSYSAITMPPIFPSKTDQSYPLLASSAGSQRILGPTNGTFFAPEVYKNSMRSSLPAVGFPPVTSFQYQGFPFDTNYSLPSNSFSASMAYAGSTSGGSFCFPAMSSHYPNPYSASFSGPTISAGPESRRWGNQVLDLNSGPGNSHVKLPIVGTSSQAMMDDQLKMYQGILKRKEPQGGWDKDRHDSKRPSWK